MALQDGFKILSLEIFDGGSDWGASTSGKLTARAPGSHSIGVGSGFAGTWSSDGSGVINSTTITANGKNYSSGSWGYSYHGTATPGEFVSIGTRGSGKGAIILPHIGQDSSISFNQINVERGLAGDTANSDIHDLYEDFSSVAGTVHTDLTSKPNFDWFQGGPQSGSAQHPIRLDEFYGCNI